MDARELDRRAFLGAGAAMALTGIPSRAAADVANAVAPIVGTTNGPVVGLDYGGIKTYLGLRYGAPPLGPLRFMPPQKPQSWTIPADGSHTGNAAMQLRSGGSAVNFPGTIGLALEQVYSTPDDVQRQSEDCLVLNVWTPAVGDGRARPVMVWFHGGGFNYGSGNWPAYDGHNLAQRHDVVVVTVNHRLNAFGYLYLGEIGGDAFASSGNAGQLDLVAALQWVRDNIASFGGDAGNVTIFGQSGGGAKVSTLLAMPKARGLFHRAIIESGPGLRGNAKASATQTARTMMAKLGVSNAKALQAVPATALLEAAQGLQPPGGMGMLRFAPVVDGVNLPANPFDPVAPQLSADIPIMIGCTKDEQTLYNVGFPWWGKISEADAVEKLRPQFGAKAEALIAAVKKTNPTDDPSYLYTDVISKTFAFIGSVTLAERKAAQRAAPVYMYIWNWGAPVGNGILRAPHTMEIPFAFDNVDKGPLFLGTESSTKKLAATTSGAWVAFARTGDPNVGGLPHWAPYDATTRATMIFDLASRVENDPNAEVRKLLAGA